MSAHTMPQMSLLCEDFVKSMVKSSNFTTSSDNTSNSEDALTTRLNGDMNGFGTHTDDEDDEVDRDGDVKMSNGLSPSPQARKIRKDLMNKTEELKRKQKSLGISENSQPPPPANDDEESKLRFLSKQAISLDF